MSATPPTLGAPTAAIAFEGFVFDPARATLHGPDGAEIALRPKTYAMLALLMANRGRVVSREELLEAVWPGIYVSDDSITQCVSEIRRALGAQGPRLLRTVPKRGYLLDFTPEAPAVPAPAPAAPPPAPAAEPVPELPDLPRLLGPPVAPPPLPPPAASVPGWWATLRLPVAVLSAAVLAAVGVGVLWRPQERPVAMAPAAPTESVVAPGTAPASPALAVAVDGEARRVAVQMHRDGVGQFNRSTPANGGWLVARALFEQAIATDPTYAPAHAWAALSYTNQVLTRLSPTPGEDLARAQAHAERAMQLDPALPEAAVARAAVNRLHRRWDDALRDYRRAVAMDATQLPSQANSGLMLVLLGRPAEGEQPIRQALATNPSHFSVPVWQTYLGLAQMQQQAGDFGTEAFRRSLSRAGNAYLDAPERQLHLAAALALSGQWEDARAIAAGVKAVHPEMTQSWFRARPLSEIPAFLAQRETFYRGLAIAGVPE